MFWGGKQLPSNCRNFLPMFVVVCLLNGRLNHVMFRFLLWLLCFMLVVLSFSGLYVSVFVDPLFCSASWYLCAFVYALWDIFYDARWVIAVFVDVEGSVVLFHVWFVFSSC